MRLPRLSKLSRARRAAFSLVIAFIFAVTGFVPQAHSAQVACTPSAGYTDCYRFTYSGADQTFTVPNNFVSGKPLLIETWGAGGGSSTYYGAYSPNNGGAGGGYSKTAIKSVAAGNVFTIVVGQGGLLGNSTTGAYGGGGPMGASTASSKGSGGGGFSGVFLGANKTQPLVIAGGGGGASPGATGNGYPGGGGGIGNAPATGSESGQPATVSAGGAAGTSSGCGAAPTAGSAYQGGTGGTTGEPGGGGGGGYFGGGGGPCQVNGSAQNGGGGGGSGYVLSSRATVLDSGDGGAGPLCANCYGRASANARSSAQWVSGIGDGGPGDTATDGGNGMVVVQYSTVVPSAFTCDSTFYSIDSNVLTKLVRSAPSARNTNYWGMSWTSIGSAGASFERNLAYRDADNLLYSLRDDYALMQIDSTGTQRAIAYAGATPAANEIIGSAYSSADDVIYLMGANTAYTTFYWYKIDFLDAVPKITLISNPANFLVQDFAISSGFAYAADSNGNLRKFNLATGAATTTTISGITTGTYFSAQWFDGTSLYVQSGDRQFLYRIDNLATPVAVKVAQATASALSYNHDGANCSTGGSSIPTIVGPAAVADTSSGAPAVAQTISVLSNDTLGMTATATGASNNAFTSSSVKFCTSASTDAQCLTGGSYNVPTLTISGKGAYVANADGTVTFTPLSNFVGTADTVRYTVSDANNMWAISTIIATVSPPAAPASANLTSTGVGTAVQTVTPTVPSGATLTLMNGSTATNGPVAVSGGSYSLSGGVITFTPALGFSGAIPPVTYKITDSYSQSSSATYTPTVTKPTAPSPTAVTSSGLFGATQSGTVSVPQGGSVSLRDASGAATNGPVVVVGGSYSVVNGVITFTPAAGFSGAAPAVTYAVADAYGQVSTSTYVPTVTALPAVSSLTSSAAAGLAQSVSVSVPVGGSATLINASGQATSGPVVVVGGSYSIVGGVITFTPAAGFSGAAPAVTYRVTDSLGQVSTSTYVPTSVAPAAPVVSALSSSGGVGVSQSVTVVKPVGGSVSLLDANGAATSGPVHVTGGTYSLDQATGIITFVPDAGFSGVAQTVQVRTTDAYAQSSTSPYTATVAATPPPAPPVPSIPAAVAPKVNNDFVTARAGKIVMGTVSSNDELLPGASYQVADQPLHGTLGLAPNGDFVYSPAPGFSGEDSFSYRVCLPAPNQSICSVAIVRMALTKVVRPPVSITIGYFADGSARITKRIKAKITAFVSKHADYQQILCSGFTEGPTIQVGDSRLALARAKNACSYVRKVSNANFAQKPAIGMPGTQVGGKFRKIVLTLTDKG